MIGEAPVTGSVMLWSIIEDKPKTNAVEEARPVIQFVTSLKFDVAMAEHLVERGFIGLHIARDFFFASFAVSSKRGSHFSSRVNLELRLLLLLGSVVIGTKGSS